ncbi:MAG: TolC family protein [Cyanobacteria bacterium SBLK]|nr:TolC family protein [Cyanobacteria bacterium SBLK]
MLVFRHLVVVSAGAILACGYGVPAISQESPATESSPEPTVHPVEHPVPPEADTAGESSLRMRASKPDKQTTLEEDEPKFSLAGRENRALDRLDNAPIALEIAERATGGREIGSVETIDVLAEMATNSLAFASQKDRFDETPTGMVIDEVALTAESKSPLIETVEPNVPSSAPNLSWEPDIPAVPLEISENLTQHSSASATGEVWELSQLPVETDPELPEEEESDKVEVVEEVVEDVAPLLDPEESAPRGRQVIPPPENLDPGSNPLLFPTEPDEVRIDLSQPITLEQAIALTRRNNQDWRVAWLNLEKADAALRQALAANFPSLSAEINLSRTDSATTELSNRRLTGRGLSASTSDTTTDLLDGTLTLSYTLYDGGSRPAQIRQAEETVRFNQLEVERIGEELRLSTANAYYNLQEANASVEIEQAAVDAAKQTLRDAELLERAGLGTRFDVLRAQVDLANSQQNLVNSRANRKIAERQLVQVLALGEQVEVSIADRIERSRDWTLSLEETIILAYRNRAELEQQLVQREIDEQQRQVALSVLRPQVSLFASYTAANILSFGEGFADGYALGATLSWTLFDGGAAKANSRQEELDIEIAEATFEQQRKSIRVEVEEAYENLNSSDENIKTAIVAVQLAEESLRLARLRFQAGVGTQTEVIDAQTELTRARGNLLTATVGYNRALASLQRAVSNVPDNRLFDLP